MAIPVRVTQANGNNYSGATALTQATSAFAATAGNHLAVLVTGLSVPVAGVTDTAGNTYVQAGSNGVSIEIWYAENILGHASNVVTVTYTAAVAFRDVTAIQHSGLRASGSFGAFAGGTAASGATVSCTPTVTHAVEQVTVVVAGVNAAGTWTFAPSGFTTLFTNTSSTFAARSDALRVFDGSVPIVATCTNTPPIKGLAAAVFLGVAAVITGSAVFGVTTTVRASRAIAFGLDGNTNVHDEAGTFKVFGDVAVTGDLAVGGALPAHATTHEAGGVDPIQLDDLAPPSDNTDLNASTTAHGLLRKLSGLDVQVLRGDGTWGMSPLTSGVFAYVFSTTTTEPPASQRIRVNAAHPYTAVTKLWADFDSANSEDLYWGWMKIRVGSLVMVQDKDSHLQYAEFTTTGVPIDKGTYVELPVVWASNGTALAVQAVLVRVTAPAPGGSGTNAFGTIQVSGQSDVVADAAPDTLTLVAGSGVTLTTNAGSDSITIAASSAAVRRQVTVILDGGGSAITTGVKAYLSLPVAGTWQKWRLLSIDSAATAGSIVIDVWKDTYTNYPPAVADTITASAKPTLSSVNKNESSTLTGWTTAFSAGDVIGVTVDSVTTVTKVQLVLEFE